MQHLLLLQLVASPADLLLRLAAFVDAQTASTEDFLPVALHFEGGSACLSALLLLTLASLSHCAAEQSGQGRSRRSCTTHSSTGETHLRLP